MNFERMVIIKYKPSPLTGEEVVVSGMSGRFPESDDVDQFFKNMCNNNQMITDDNRRWDHSNLEIPHRTGKINHIEKMDAGAFGLHYKQAYQMDPIIRTLMERAYEAVLDAGFNISEIRNSKTAVFVGQSLSEAEECLTYTNLKSPNFECLGCFRSFAAQRISAFFGLEGTSINVDTACSSFTSALELAYQAIRRGDCDFALIAGVNLTLNPTVSLQFKRLGVLSPDGVPKVFDKDANGYVRSESVSVVFLQKSVNARRIYAQLVNIKSNSDGYKEHGLIHPSSKMQAQLMEEVYKECSLDLNHVDFFEAHGTGTLVGDKEEMMAIDQVYAKNRKHPLLVGSTKSHMGHSESGSGCCSLIKMLLQMDSGVIVHNVNYKTPNPDIIGLCEGRVIVPVEVQPWPENGFGFAVMNNVGFGGSNVHAILKRWNKVKVNNGEPLDDIPRLVCVSGRTEKAVWNILESIGNANLDAEFVRLLQQTFKNTESEHPYRGYIVQSKEKTVTKSVASFDGLKKSLHLIVTSDLKKLIGLGKELTQINVFAKRMCKFHMDKDESYLSPECAVVTFVGLVDLFKAVGVCFDFVTTTCFKEIMSANDNTSLKKVIQSATNRILKQSDSIVTDRRVVVALDATTPGEFVLSLKEPTLNSFLALLGDIYVQGYQINCECLYPEVEWPVSAGTAKISPIIRWNHAEDWNVFKSELDRIERNCQINLLSAEIDWSFLEGHNIDGLAVVPATGYIYMVMIQYCKVYQLLIEESTFVFEQVRFHQVVHITKDMQNSVFHVYFQKFKNRFEIIHERKTVVSGYIYVRKHIDDHLSNTLLCIKNSSDDHLQMEDIYKEFNLRGYKYKELFSKIHHSELNGNTSWIKWEDNWVTFLDNLLQTALLKLDTRNLHVPITIGELTVDNTLHANLIRLIEEDKLLPVYNLIEANMISCGSVCVRGLLPNSIPRRKIRDVPTIRRHVFVPFDATLSLEDALRVCVDIVLDCINKFLVKAVEVVDFNEQKVLIPKIIHVFKGIPLVRFDATVLTKTNLEISGVKIDDNVLKNELDCSLIILTDAGKHPQINDAVSVLNSPGFIISYQNTQWITSIDGLEPVATIVAGDKTLVLLKKNDEQPLKKFFKLKLDGSTFDWIPKLQAIIREKHETVLVVENETESGVLGFFNCIKRETNENLFRLVFIMDPEIHFDQNDEFFTKQLKKSLRVNVLKDGVWGSYRHLSLREEEMVKSEDAYCRITQVGNMSSLKWFKRPPIEVSTGLLIDVYYSAINFKNLTVALGLINPEVYAKCRIDQAQCFNEGLEYSGKDSRGKRVMGFSALGGTFSNRFVAEPGTTYDIPDDWSMQEAATVPVCYSTVIFVFMTVQLKEGESILIHAGSGGIGQAAMHIATFYKCNIFTTVSTEEKRQFVRTHFPNLPDTHIGYSRDSSFVEMVLKQTHGRGVDVVINSLTEDKLQASMRCLATRGRFAEIGKMDMLKNNRMELVSLSQGRVFYSICLDILFGSNIMFQKKYHDTVRFYLKEGIVKPLHYTVFNYDEIEQAYRTMANAQHVGKLLLRVREENKPPTIFNCFLRFHCNPHSTYIIVGGLGGVGLELADWLVLRGARKLVLVSRTGVETGYTSYRLRGWRSHQVTVKISKQDVTTSTGCAALLQEATQMGDVAAIFNLALVLMDDVFENQNETNFLATLHPKSTATRLLDALSRDLCPNLSLFVNG